MTQSVFDKNAVKADFIIRNQRNEIDTVILLDFDEQLIKEKTKSLTEYYECGHFFYYRYKFLNETIDLSLSKSATELKIKFIGGFCKSQEKTVVSGNKLGDSIVKFDFENCERSQLKSIILKRFVIAKITTQNGDIWEPIGYLPRK